MNKRAIVFISLASLLAITLLLGGNLALQQVEASHGQGATSTENIPGLRSRAEVVRDLSGVPHITASDDHDVYFMMGYLQAQDRFFQMDILRRQGSGTLAELFGAGPGDGVLEDDVLFRGLGVKRAAERSLQTYSPGSAALIQAYSDGVNAWLDRRSLPPEYSPLEITQVPRWTPLDSIIVSKLIEFRLSIDLSDVARNTAGAAYLIVGRTQGIDVLSLFFDDIFSVTPFDRAVTVPNSASGSSLSPQGARRQFRMVDQTRQAQELAGSGIMEAARTFLERHRQFPLLKSVGSRGGSNWWVVAGSKTNTGNAMLASDPHLGLGVPSNFYEIHLVVDSKSSPMNVYGVSFPGVPGVILGQNERISWGASTALFDVTDCYFEDLVFESGAPVATRYKGATEPLVAIPERFRINQGQNGVADDVVEVSPGGRPSGVTVPAATLIVPRRNNGPLIIVSEPGGISVQYTGFSATHDLESILTLARARNLADFKHAIRSLETTTQNWAYADVDGNIAYFSSGKIPIREDLQNNRNPDGQAPNLIRDGTGNLNNEWISKTNNGPGVNFESLPFEEMPQSVNPAQGYLVNANNDPIGITFSNNPFLERPNGGLYYISSNFDAGIRAARITSLLDRQFENRRGHGKVSFKDMQDMQGDVQLFDAEVFMPHIIQAFNAARSEGAPAELAALANDPAVREAVRRLSNWDFSAPTGIPEGYDARDVAGIRLSPSKSEVSNSVAATIYTLWRSRIVANTLIATLDRVDLGGFQPEGPRMLVNLRSLLNNFPFFQGTGFSGLDFFEVPGFSASPEQRRDFIMLKSLKEALDVLAGDEFADVFGGSTNQDDYRWGKLHRITFSHPFGPLAPQFSIPTGGNFENLSPTLPGLALDGGMETVDTGPFDVRAASSQDFVFGFGAARRYVGELRRGGINAAQVIPGGESGVPGNRFYANQLSLWLTNDYHRVLITNAEINCERFSKTTYRPAD
jgi:penicillin G amidase